MKTPFFAASRGRRRGVAVVYVGLFFVVFVSVTAFSIDMSRLYVKRAQAQKAADAAALAGAFQYGNGTGYLADFEARKYAAREENGAYIDKDAKDVNGIYLDSRRNAKVTTTFQPLDEFGVQQLSWFRVTVQRDEPTFFAGIFGSQFKIVPVGASCTALFEKHAEIPIKGNGTYGVAPGPVNLSLFGPDAWYNNGDRYSTRLNSKNPQGPNGEYRGFDSNLPESQKGYSFSIKIPESYRTSNTRAYLQIFDPDCFNAGGNVNAVKDVAIDEMRQPNGSNGAAANATTTKYRLWYDSDGPKGPLGESVLPGGEKSYGGAAADAATDMLWNDFFVGDLSQLSASGTLRLQVISTAGSSENGFDLRIDNKPAASASIQRADRGKAESAKNVANQFNTNNGTSILAQGSIPINFNVDGTVVMNLGFIPKTAAGGKMTINNFDTDITNRAGSHSVIYKCDTPITGKPNGYTDGPMSGNGETAEYNIDLPTDYQGGNWTATYSAGEQDTSVWDMSYEKGPGIPKRAVRIVR